MVGIVARMFTMVFFVILKKLLWESAIFFIHFLLLQHHLIVLSSLVKQGLLQSGLHLEVGFIQLILPLTGWLSSPAVEEMTIFSHW